MTSRSRERLCLGWKWNSSTTAAWIVWARGFWISSFFFPARWFGRTETPRKSLTNRVSSIYNQMVCVKDLSAKFLFIRAVKMCTPDQQEENVYQPFTVMRIPVVSWPSVRDWSKECERMEFFPFEAVEIGGIFGFWWQNSTILLLFTRIQAIVVVYGVAHQRKTASDAVFGDCMLLPRTRSISLLALGLPLTIPNYFRTILMWNSERNSTRLIWKVINVFKISPFHLVSVNQLMWFLWFWHEELSVALPLSVQQLLSSILGILWTAIEKRKRI